MINRGKVISIWRTEEPASGKSCMAIETDATDVDRSPWNNPCNCVYVKLGQKMPAIGQVIGWGPHRVWWFPNVTINKLGNSFNRSDPLH